SLYSISKERNQAEEARAQAEAVSTELVSEKQAREELEAEATNRWSRIRAERREEYDRRVAQVAATKPLSAMVQKAQELVSAWEASGREEPTAELWRVHEQALND